jgi:rhamnosyltransferase subunit B
MTRAAKRILITTFGSLGDIHPYVAVALELQRRGHQPCIASFDLHRAAVEAAGVAFHPVRPGLEVFGSLETVARRLFGSLRGPEYMIREIFMRHLHESYLDTAAAARGADLMLTHPLTFSARLVAEQQGLPWISTVLAPLNLFSALEPPLYPAGAWLQALRGLGVGPYRLTFGALKRLTRHWEAPLRRYRGALGLPPQRGMAQFEGQFSSRLNLALFSPLLSAPVADWPAHTLICGFPRYDGNASDGETADLQRFLDAGEAPIVFALGSAAVMIAGDFWRHAASAAQALGRRAILLTGRTAQPQAAWPAHVYAVPYLPYSAVFPRAAAVVHQAGVGTLAQALAAGRPQLIVPVAFDQFDNAQRAQRLGVARVLPFRQVSTQRLAAQLQALFDAPACAQRATTVAAALGQENGAARAADAIEGVLAGAR